MNARTPVEPHDWVITSTTHNGTTYTCTICGETKVEGIPFPATAEPGATATPNLDYEPDETATPVPSEEPEATTTPAGNNKNESSKDNESADHTHTLGACTPNDDSTHTQSCSVCGRSVSATCTMTDTIIGDMNASACIYCGYITWKLDDAANGKQEAKAVENATFELVDEKGAVIESNNLSLVVYESEPEATIQLDTGASVIVKKALTVTVLEDSTPVTLANTVKLSIPMEDDLTGLKLLVVDENGELIEIEYEVIDGMMVFETNILGIFMLVQEI